MTTAFRLLVCAIIIFCWLASDARADIVYFATTDSYYEYIAIVIDWESAKAAAEAKSHLGRAGRLATITSLAENDFLLSSFTANPEGQWIGGYQQLGSTEPESGWRWITDEPFSFTRWFTGEPDNDIGNPNEKYLEFRVDGLWNDLGGPPVVRFGYYVEYDNTPAAVPEPTSFLLTTCALGCGAFVARRRKQVACAR